MGEKKAKGQIGRRSFDFVFLLYLLGGETHLGWVAKRSRVKDCNGVVLEFGNGQKTSYDGARGLNDGAVLQALAHGRPAAGEKGENVDVACGRRPLGEKSRGCQKASGFMAFRTGRKRKRILRWGRRSFGGGVWRERGGSATFNRDIIGATSRRGRSTDTAPISCR